MRPFSEIACREISHAHSFFIIICKKVLQVSIGVSNGIRYSFIWKRTHTKKQQWFVIIFWTVYKTTCQSNYGNNNSFMKPFWTCHGVSYFPSKALCDENFSLISQKTLTKARNFLYMTYIIFLEMHLKGRHEASFWKISAKSNHSCVLSCLTILNFLTIYFI